MRKSYQKIVLLICAAFLCGSFLTSINFAQPAHADSQQLSDSQSQELILSPFIFDEQIGKGQSAEEQIIVSNNSNQPLQLSAQSSDFTPGGDGQQPIFNPDQTQINSAYSLSTWITVGKIPKTIAANSKITVPVKISVPAKAEDGSHYGGVLFTYSTSSAADDVTIIKKAATLFFVQTGIANPQISISKFSTNKNSIGNGSVQFQTTFANSGNVHLQPKGYIHITNIFGELVASVQVNPAAQIVLPQTSRTFSSAWNSGLRIGPYHLQEVAYYGDQAQQNFEAHTSLTVWFIPLKFIFIIIFLLLVIIFCARMALRKYKQHVLRAAGLAEVMGDDPHKRTK
jgi:hypothetical protein